MKILTTKRLEIQEASLDDAPFFLALLNSPNWIEFIGDRNIRSLGDAENYIQNSLINSYEKNGFGLYKMTLREKGVPLGICGILKRDYLDHVDLGFAILPEYESFGYTFEASKAVLEYGKFTLNLDPIAAITNEQNVRSQRLLLKLGFLKIGPIKPEGVEDELLLFSTK